MKSSKRRELRSEMKRLLAHLDERWVRAASRKLCRNVEQLFASPRFRERKKVLAWTSFFPGEIDLAPLMSSLMDEKTFYLPRSHPDGSMIFISVGEDWTTELDTGVLGIPEPREVVGERFSPERDALDTIVLVPGLAFDRLGNRLGRGKGYYDRFLSLSSMSEAEIVGLAWDLQVVPHINPQSHDVPVDYLCTEEGVIATTLL